MCYSINYDKKCVGAKLQLGVRVRRPRRFFAKSVVKHCFTLFHNEADPGVQWSWPRRRSRLALPLLCWDFQMNLPDVYVSQGSLTKEQFLKHFVLVFGKLLSQLFAWVKVGALISLVFPFLLHLWCLHFTKCNLHVVCSYVFFYNLRYTNKWVPREQWWLLAR